MNNYPVDVTIYLKEMSNAISEPEMREGINEEFGITNFAKFEQLLLEEIELCSLDNFNSNGIAQLMEEQFIDCVERGVVQYFIDELVTEGKIEAVVDVDDMCVKYQITEKGIKQELLNQIHLN